MVELGCVDKGVEETESARSLYEGRRHSDCFPFCGETTDPCRVGLPCYVEQIAEGPATNVVRCVVRMVATPADTAVQVTSTAELLKQRGSEVPKRN
jgi:hypothetical protein